MPHPATIEAILLLDEACYQQDVVKKSKNSTFNNAILLLENNSCSSIKATSQP